MYLSSLLIDVGDNPDRPRPGRTWLCNLYHVHQRLCMAFPSDPKRNRDPDFLEPYAHKDFPEDRHLADRKKAEVGEDTLRQMHAQRDGRANFLFRIDPQPGGSPAILVQSALKPDWDYAFHNAGFLLAAPPGVREFGGEYAKGQSLMFRLLANATRKINTKTRADGSRSNGRRVPVRYEKLNAWLANKGEHGGFSFRDDSVTRQPGYVYVRKTGEDIDRLFSVRFDGLLRVTDPDAFRETLVHGIGPAKAFGFGLLSVAPVRQ